MNVNRWCLVGLAALTPITVQVHTRGDTVATITTARGTRIEVMGGVGEYAFISRGCQGEILSSERISFREAGGAIEQDLGGTGLTAGLRGGWMRDGFAAYEDGTAGSIGSPSVVQGVVIENHYLNPYLTYAKPRGSVGLGWVFHPHEFITASEGARLEPDHPLNDLSGHIRLGGERRYFALRWMEGVPLYSSGGYLTAGVGGHPGGSPWSVYGGMGAGGPFEGAGLMLQSGYQFRNGLTANLRTRLGQSGDRGASGVAIGVGYGAVEP